MNVENKELLEKVITKDLKIVLSDNTDPEEVPKAHKRAMESISKSIELEKLDRAEKEHNRDLIVKHSVDAVFKVVGIGVQILAVYLVNNFEEHGSYIHKGSQSVVRNVLN